MTQDPAGNKDAASTTTKVANDPFFSDKFREQMKDSARTGMRVAAFATPIIVVGAIATAVATWISKR